MPLQRLPVGPSLEKKSTSWQVLIKDSKDLKDQFIECLLPFPNASMCAPVYWDKHDPVKVGPNLVHPSKMRQ